MVSFVCHNLPTNQRWEMDPTLEVQILIHLDSVGVQVRSQTHLQLHLVVT